MNRSIAVMAVLLASLAAACGSAPLVDPAWSSKAGLEVMRLRWTKSLSPTYQNFYIPEMVEEHDRFRPVETGGAAFDTDKRRIFVGSAIGGLYCLDAITGATVWRFDVDDPVGSTPLYDSAKSRVYFGADDGFLYAVHARSGRLLWKLDTGAEIRRKIFSHDGTIYFANADNTVFAVEPDSGEVVWRFRRPPVEGFSASGYADILLSGAIVYAAFADGTASALDAVTGAVVWTADLAEDVVAATRDGDVNLVDADATPVLVEGTLAVASVSGGLWGLEAETGNVSWTRSDLVGVTGLAAANDHFYAAQAGGKGLCAIAPKDGRTVWCSPFGLGVLQDPVLFEDIFLVADSEAGLFAVATSTGKVLQRLDDRGGFYSRPAEHAGYLVVLGNRSTVYALSIR